KFSGRTSSWYKIRRSANHELPLKHCQKILEELIFEYYKTINHPRISSYFALKALQFVAKR
ncbi:hypothetical protein ISN45_At01g041860, partial [Arabidopsis thaliana x Arabidopsis arenosa]